MKKLFIFFFVSIYAVMLFANPVKEKTARKVALNWFSYKAKGISQVSISSYEAYKYDSQTSFYIYNFKNGGFVIVSADDAALPILGYSVKNYFPKDIKNEALNDWLQAYAKEVVRIKKSKSSNAKTINLWDNILNKKFKSSAKAVAPLVQSTWNQEPVYNKYCPSGTPTGCVATSIAQIMKYTFDKAGIASSVGYSQHSYIHPTYGLQTANFKNTTYYWAHMPLHKANDTIALMNYHVGVAVDMDYATDGSGSQIYYLLYALPNYFGFDQSIKYVEKANYTDTQWSNLLKSEIDAQRPIEYAGFGSAGGHAFVCDGYDDSGKFHFNWGWGSSADGYFAIGALNPSGDDFNKYNAAVINIKLASSYKFTAVSKPTNFNKYASKSSPYMPYVSAVNDFVAWGIAADGSSSGANYRIYTKTIDGGFSWQPNQITNLGGTAFSMIDGLNIDTAYIAMYGTGTDNHILRTYDGGKTWKSILNSAGASSFFNIVHFFNDTDGVVQGDPENGEFEIYTTSDGGDTWTRVPGANIPDPLSKEYGTTGHFTAVGDTIWFSTTKGRIFRSIDKGLNWTVKTLYTNSEDLSIEDAFDKTGTGWALVSYTLDAGTSTQRDTSLFFKTTDAGDNWSQVTNPNGNIYGSAISAVPGVPGMFYTAGHGVSYTTDGGNTWTDLADYLQDFYFTSIAMASPEKGFMGTFASGYSGGAWIIGSKEGIVAKFLLKKHKSCLDTNVVFESNSTGNITNYAWNFGSGAVPATSSDAGPVNVYYTTSGMKKISLTITDATTSTVRTKEDSIFVNSSAPNPIDNINGPKKVLPSSTNNYYVDAQDSVDFVWTVETPLVSLVGNSNTNSVNIKFPAFLYNTTIKVYATNGCGTTDNATLPVQVTNNTAIKELNTQFSISPNPATNRINIVSENIIKEIKIVSVSGKQVFDSKCNSTQVTVDLRNYKRGMYVVSVATEKGISTKKVILQ